MDGKRLLVGAVVALWALSGCSRKSEAPGGMVTLDVDNPGGGSVVMTLGGQQLTCEGRCAVTVGRGVHIRMEAVPDTATFQGWGGAGPDCTTDPVCELVLATDTMVAARFTYHIAVTLSGTPAGGSITSAGGDIDCPDVACEADVLVGSVVSLSAQEQYSFFYGWSDDCESAAREPTCEFTANAGSNVGARFEHFLLDGAGGASDEAAHAVALDPTLDGAYFVAGSYSSSDLSLRPGEATLPFDAGTDMFVARVLPGATIDWVHTFRGAGTLRPYGLAVDVENATPVVYVAGAFTGEINFGMGTVDPTGDPNGFVVKMDRFGVVWARQVTGDSVLTSVAPSPNLDEVFVAGFFELTADFGNGIAPTSQNQNRHQAVLALYNKAGTIQSASGYGRIANTHTEATAVVVDPNDNNPVLVGLSNTNWDNGTNCTFAASSMFDGFVLKADRMDPHGCIWVTPVDTGGSDMVSGLALAGNTAWIAGKSEGPDQLFLGAYSLTDGSEVTAPVTYAASAPVAVPGLAYDPNTTGIVMAGGFAGTVTFDATHTVTSNGINDLFVARFDATGAPLDSVSFGGAMDDSGGGPADENVFDDSAPTFRVNYASACVAATAAGAALVAGRTGSPSFQVVEPYPGQGGDDLFVLQVAPYGP